MRGGQPPAAAALIMARLGRASIPWALWRLVRGRGALGHPPGLRFAKVLGSGQGGGFGTTPGLDHQGVFAGFETAEQARVFVESSATAQAYRSRSIEYFSAVLLPTSSRGSWSGHQFEAREQACHQGPVVALTRASIKPQHLLAFWRHSPPSERDLGHAPGCRLAVGLGEAPLLRQATFSWWDSIDAMNGFARHGAHQQAIRASWGGGYFSEWMFVRFRPAHMRGSWQGRSFDEECGIA